LARWLKAADVASSASSPMVEAALWAYTAQRLLPVGRKGSRKHVASMALEASQALARCHALYEPLQRKLML